MARRHARVSSVGATVRRHQLHAKQRSMSPQPSDPVEIEPRSLALPVDNNGINSRDGDAVEVLIYRQMQIDSSVAKMTAYALQAVLFGAFQLALLGINFQSQEYIETVIFYPFHLGEFWAIFLFTLLEAFILTTSGALELVDQLGRWRYVYYATMGVNIVLTFVAAVLLSMDDETFEGPAHFIEYGAQIPIALIDAVFILQQHLLASKAQSISPLSFAVLKSALTSAGGLLSLVVFIASILQLFAYTEVFEVSIPGEQVAHFFEFPIEFINASIALWFAVRTRDSLRRSGVANLTTASMVESANS